MARRSNGEKGFLACRARHHFWQPKNRLAIDRSCSIFGTRLTACCQIFFSPCPLFVNFRVNAGKHDRLLPPSTFFERSPPLPSVTSNGDVLSSSSNIFFLLYLRYSVFFKHMHTLRKSHSNFLCLISFVRFSFRFRIPDYEIKF